METVTLSPYDPSWPSKFDKIKQTLIEALTDFQPTPEHIGSTSVPNLDAKPIIDVMVGVKYFLPEQIIKKIEVLGYEHWKEDPFQHERLMFTKRNKNGERLVNIHVTPTGSEFWINQLTFRDKLRADKHLMNTYKELKTKLAKQYKKDPEGYTAAKTDFVREVLEQ